MPQTSVGMFSETRDVVEKRLVFLREVEDVAKNAAHFVPDAAILPQTIERIHDDGRLAHTRLA